MSTETEQVLEAENWGDPNVDIMKAMDEYFDAPSQGVAEKEIVTQEAKVVPEKEPAAVKKEEEKPIIDENFFSDSEETPGEEKEEQAKAFDEEEFDKQTEVEVKGMEMKAGEKFRALKAELKAAKQSVLTPDVKAKMEALELKAQEAEGLRLRITEISAQSAKLQVENDDSYQTEVVQPAADIFTRADALASMYETEPTLLRAIIKERDRKVQNELIAEHLADFSDFDRNEAYRMIQDFNGLVTKRDRMMENAEKTIEKSRANKIENDKRLLEEQRQVVQTFQKNIWQKYKEHIPGLVVDGTDTPALKALMSKALSIDFGKAKAYDQAFAAFAGITLPHAVSEIASLKKRLSAYEQADVKSVKQAPGAGSSVTATPSTENAAKTFEEAMAADYNFT